MKYILGSSNTCYQIYLSQYVFCAYSARMVGGKNGIFDENTHKQRDYRRVFTPHIPSYETLQPIKPTK